LVPLGVYASRKIKEIGLMIDNFNAIFVRKVNIRKPLSWPVYREIIPKISLLIELNLEQGASRIVKNIDVATGRLGALGPLNVLAYLVI